MARRGTIVVECSVKGCSAEEVMEWGDLEDTSVDDFLNEKGWALVGRADICPQCAEEGKADAPQR